VADMLAIFGCDQETVHQVIILITAESRGDTLILVVNGNLFAGGTVC